VIYLKTIQLKTIVPKQGDIKSYVNKPFLNRIDGDPFNSKAIGIITDAVEVENGYKLTIALWKSELVYEWFEDGELSAMSFKTEFK
jgi:ubiquitin C-terminal hydrolase